MFDDEEDDNSGLIEAGDSGGSTDFSSQRRRAPDFSSLDSLVPAAGGDKGGAKKTGPMDFSGLDALVPKTSAKDVPLPRSRPSDLPQEAQAESVPLPRPRPDIGTPAGPDDVGELTDQPYRSGGRALDAMLGSEAGMLSGNEAVKQRTDRITASEQAVTEADANAKAARKRHEDLLSSAQLTGEAGDVLVKREMRKRAGLGKATSELNAAKEENEAANASTPSTQEAWRDKLERVVPAATQQVRDMAVGGARLFTGTLSSVDYVLQRAMGIDNPDTKAIDIGQKAVESAADSINDWSRQRFNADTTQDKNFGSQLVQGITSTGVFALTGAAGRFAGLNAAGVTGVAGALPQAEQQYQQALRAEQLMRGYAQAWMKNNGLDVSEETANSIVRWSMFATGLGIGATEAVPIAHMFDRLERASGGGLTRYLGVIGAQAGEEGIQEGVQQLLQNSATRALLDPNQSITKDVADNALVGALSGALVTGVFAMPSILARDVQAINDALPPPGESPIEQMLAGAQQPEPPPPPPPSAPPGAPAAQAPTPATQVNEGVNPPVNPNVSPLERRTLRKKGYSDEQIDAMGRAEIADEVGEAAEQGIEPGEESAEQPAATPPVLENGAASANAQADQAMAGLSEMFGGKPPEQQIAPTDNKVPAKEPETAGTKESPIPVKDGFDLLLAQQHVAPNPTPGQKEAENYKMGHIRWPKLRRAISIETAKGGERVAPDGSWRVPNYPVVYGRIKGTKGADGQQIDAFLGDDVSVPHAFILDQYDPKTGKFDEHKTFFGIKTADDVARIYDSVFTDGSGRARRGAITQVPMTVMNAWMLNGKKTKAFGKEGPQTAQQDTGPVPVGEQPTTPMANAFNQDGKGVPIPPEQKAAEGKDEFDTAFDAALDEGEKKPDAAAATSAVIEAVDAVVPAESVDPADIQKAAQIVAETGKEPGEAFQEVMAQQTEETADADNSAAAQPTQDSEPGAVSESVPGQAPSGQSEEGEQLSSSSQDGEGGEAVEGRAPAAETEAERPGDAAEADDAGVGDGLPLGRNLTDEQIDKVVDELGAAGGHDAANALFKTRAKEFGHLDQQEIGRKYKARFGSPAEPSETVERQFGTGNFIKIKVDALEDGKFTYRADFEVRGFAGGMVGSDEGGLPSRGKALIDAAQKLRRRFEEIRDSKLTTPDSARKAAVVMLKWLNSKFAAPKSGDEKVNTTAALAGKFATYLRDGGEFGNILAARKMAKDAGFDGDAKAVEEAMELGVVLLAREIAADRTDPKANFTALVDLYSRQPKLGTRTSTSMRDQAFSTPVPLAYVASRLAGIGPETTVHEPTAGNGALLIEADPSKTDANEINPQRAENLASQGFAVSKHDAATEKPVPGSSDVVIANPPFGVTKDENGQSKGYNLTEIQSGYRTNEIDHVIALRSLAAMKDQGRAVLIIGGVNKMVSSGEGRSDAYNSKAKREFFKTLYDRYTVTDHFTVAGELWERQGAGWPVDVIVIDGRGKSNRKLPAVDVPRVLSSWDQLGGLLNGLSGRSDRQTGTTAAGDSVEGGPAGGNGRVRGGGERVSDGLGAPGQSAGFQRGLGAGAPAADRQGQGPAGNERGDTARTGAEPVAERRPPGQLDDVDAAIDAALDETFGPQAGPKSSPAPLAPRQQRTTSEVAGSAVSNAVGSADAAMAGLVQLFGAGKTVSSGLSFDAETYAKAKPLFMQAATKFAAFKNDVGELVKRMVGEMREKFGLTRDALEAMRPYLRKFIEDVRSGVINLVTGETKPAAKPAAPSIAPASQEQETATQVAYNPQSKAGNALGTLVPVNMKTSVAESLAALEKRVGPLDKYVASQLGYSDAELPAYFAAEQIDALALAIDNIERGKGFIIGDQTGIGKGRVNAAIIRWAIKNKRIPVFVTEKPNLYRDMYRDLTDIGIQDFLGGEPLILATNTGLSIPLTDDESVMLTTGDAKQQGALLNEAKADSFTGSQNKHNMVFTTYNQMQTVKGEDTARRSFLARLAPNAVLIFDESHNAGGQGQVGRKPKEGTPLNRSGFARDLVEAANGVFYSSATYAKRPDVMDLYSATDMVMAVEKKEDLGEAIAKGGVPMQQAVAAMLAKAGQYIRRERSFKGVDYATPTVPVNHEQYDGISQALALIQDFSVEVNAASDKLDAEIKAAAGAVSKDNATGGAGASSVLFTSIMHNIINQMLLAMKAGPVAKMAIEAIKRNEKPVITLANTMESFLSDYADQIGIAPGAVLDADFSRVLQKYLDRTRTIIIKKPFMKKGEKAEHRYLSDDDLGSHGLDLFNRAKAQIESLVLTDLAVSPIDRIKQDLADAGYRVGEITGRGTVLDYSGEQPVLQNRPGKETSIRGRLDTITKFNNGDYDVVILNQSGATGLSLHASKTFKDQRQRHMMIAQAEANIDTHMQMLGRVHRTGQVVVPRYSQLVADIPAEKRPAAVLAKKMASLNANTTASRGGALTAKDVPDFINEYGDQVAAVIIADDFALNHRLGNAVKIDGDTGKVTVEDAMRRVTGRIPLLPLNEQEELYARLEADYASLLEQKAAMGENALEAQTLDLKARPLERTEVVKRKSGSDSPFAMPVYIEKTSIVRQGKPFSAMELMNKLSDALGGEGRMEDHVKPDQATANAVDMLSDLELGERGQSWGPISVEREQTQRHEALGEFDEFRREQLEKIDPENKDKVEKERVKLNGVRDRWENVHQTLRPGARITIKTGNGNFTSIVLKVERTGATVNPLALSSWKATFALASAERQVTLPFSRLYENGKSPSDDQGSVEVAPVGWVETPAETISHFVSMQAGAREERYIATGNILAAYDWLNMKGRIINYTDEQGHLRQGVLTAKDFDLRKEFAKKARAIRDPAEVIAWLKNNQHQIMWSEDDVVRLSMAYDRLHVSVESAKRTGGVYYLDKALTALTKDFYKKGPVMTTDLYKPDDATMKGIVERMQKLGAVFVDRSEAGPPPTETVEQPKADEAQTSITRLAPTAERSRDAIQQAVLHAIEQVAGPSVAARTATPDALGNKPGKDWNVAEAEANNYEATGVYYPGREMRPDVFPLIAVALSANNDAVRSAYHEGWHAIEGTLAPGEIAILQRETPRLREFVTRNHPRNADMIAGAEAEEVWAEAAALYAVSRNENQSVGGIHIAARRIFEKIRQIMARIGNALAGLGFQSAEDIFGKFSEGVMAERRRALPESMRKRWWNNDRSGYVSMIQAWHGSPHDHNRFNSEKIGSGEGAQAYGWGHYFAGKREVAEFYRDKLSSPYNVTTESIQKAAGDAVEITPEYAATIRSFAAEKSITPTQAAQRVQWRYSELRDPWGTVEKDIPLTGRSGPIHKALIAAVEHVRDQGRGRLYNVNVNTEIDHMLDWDKPMSQQSEYVRKALTSLDSAMVKIWRTNGAFDPGVTGAILYGQIAREMGGERMMGPRGKQYPVRYTDEKAASLKLRALGIPGIKYLDEQSRNAQIALKASRNPGDLIAPPMTHNYVVFDDNLIDIAGKTSIRRRPARDGDVIPAPETIRGALDQLDKPLKERLSDAIDAALLTPARALWDRQIDLLRFQKAAEAVNGTVPESLDTYLAATLYPGRVGEQMKDAVKELWEPVYDAMNDRGVGRDELHEYLYARHAPERNAAIREIDPDNDAGSGMTDDEAAEIMGGIVDRVDDFRAIAALIDAIVERNRQTMLRGGLESDATLEQWREKYQYYVPLKGFESGTEDELYGSPAAGRGFDVRRPESQRALGRFDRADDILANLLDQTQRTIVRAEKNKVAKTFLRFAQANASPFYKLGLLEQRRRINPLTGLVETYTVNASPNRDEVFAAKVGGKTYYIEVKHPGLLEALKTLGADKMPGFFKFLGRLTREYSRFQTAKNPEFVFTNLVKDLQDAGFTVSSEQQARYAKRFAANIANGKALYGAILGVAEKGESREARRWFEEWREAGGKISHYGLRDLDELRKEIDRELNQRTESTAKTIALAAPRLLNPINGKIVKFLEALSDVTESTTRLAVYIAAREAGFTKAQAARLSRNATVDFNRRGAHGTLINAMYAFATANIQGNVRLLRTLRKSKVARRAAMGIVVAGMLMTYWNMSVSLEDEDKKRAYQKRKYWERERNIIIYWPGSKNAAKIPLGYGLNVFWMMGEQLAMRMLGKVGTLEAVGNILGTMVSAFNPLGSEGSFFDVSTWARGLFPTVLRPIPELALNKNWANNSIHPDPMPWTEGLPPSDRHKAFTHPAAVNVAEFINRLTGGNKYEPGWLSPYPDDVEYGWNFAVGGLGRFLANTSGTIADAVDGVERPVERMPFVRRFVASDNSPAMASDAYYTARREEQNKARRLRSAIKARTEGNDDGTADEVIGRLAAQTGARPSKSGRGIVVPTEQSFQSADKDIKALRKQEDTIRKDPKLSRTQRQEQIGELRQQMRDIMGEARSRATSIGQ